MTVSGVTAVASDTSAANVCSTTPHVNIAATITPTYDQSSGGFGTCTGKTQTKIDVTGTTLTATASQSVNSNTCDISSGTCTLPTPTAVADGQVTVTVSATASDVVTITTRTWSGGGCTGTYEDTVEGPTTYTSRVATSTAIYVLDINGPTLTVQSLTNATVAQDADQGIHTQISGGSALPGTAGGPNLGQPYTLTDTVTAPDTTTYSITDNTLKFGGDGNGDGIDAGKANDTLNVHIPACAPLGLYTVSSHVSSDDICGNHNIYTADADNNGAKTFNVTGVAAGYSLSVTTGVVAELPPDFGYGIEQCFLSSLSNKKVTNIPGTSHITSVIGLANSCGGAPDPSVYWKPTEALLTIPAGFSFSDTGKSPRAHVFIGPGDPGFDYHYPTSDPSWTEVTSLVKQTNNPMTDDIDFTTAAFLAAYPNGIPGNYEIYIRAHVAYTGLSPVTAASGNYTFFSSATATDPTNTSQSGQDDYVVVANPTTQVCVNGTLEPLP